MPIYNPDDLDIKMSGSAGGPNHNKIYIWSDIVTPTTGNGYAIDISAAGFTAVTNIQLTISNNTSVLANIPLIAIKSYTNTQVVVNVLVMNSTLVSALLTTVTGLVFATNLAGMQIHIRVEGY